MYSIRFGNSHLTRDWQKPLRHYRKVVVNMQKILDLLTGLRKIRENIPRQETVVDVFTERRAFVTIPVFAL